MRRNQKLLLCLLLLVLAIYYFLIPSKKSGRRYSAIHDNKVRHPISFYMKDVEKNDTLLKLITSQEFLHPGSSEALRSYLRSSEKPDSTYRGTAPSDSPFDVETDVLVYLHIQKVGGTVFNQHLIKDLILQKPCQCTGDVLTQPCHCTNNHGNIWLFSWFTVGWPCGLHADWTMLHECVDNALNNIEGKKRKRRYFYITLLRDPVSRYLSEWRHQQTGQHWEDAKLTCDGKRVSLFDVRPCFQDTWEDVSLNEFMECRDNLATNRQTRMLANLSKSECYRRNKMKPEKRAELQILSAIENLDKISFFGLTKYQQLTQKLFEKTFNLKFEKEFHTLDDEVNDIRVSEDEFVHIMKYIELDVQLYLHAKQMFMARTRDLL
ncbi:sulfotransferase [Mactra antiquata]